MTRTHNEAALTLALLCAIIGREVVKMTRKRWIMAALVVVLAGCAVYGALKLHREQQAEAERLARMEAESAEYAEQLAALCASYGLDDAKVEIEDDRRVAVTSAKFETLSAKSAFSFAKALDGLDDGYVKKRVTHVLCGRNDYQYDWQSSADNTRFEYLMCYANAVVTYRNGEYVWDNWQK